MYKEYVFIPNGFQYIKGGLPPRILILELGITVWTNFSKIVTEQNTDVIAVPVGPVNKIRGGININVGSIVLDSTTHKKPTIIFRSWVSQCNNILIT